jgi:probable F420-dependent oxidoreductase
MRIATTSATQQEADVTKVKFGLWYDFRNPPAAGRPFHSLYGETLEQIAYAETLGFDQIWTSEDHFIDDGYSPSLLPICAAIAARTDRVRIGTNVLLLPLHNPLRVAEDAATVDVISGGRFDLGVAVGYRLEEFETFGVDRHKRGRMMDEAVTLVRRAWDEDEFTFAGRYYNFPNVRLTPKPVQSPAPIWVGGFTEPAIRRAGRLGDGALNLSLAHIPAFLEEWHKRGRRDDEVKVLIGPGTMRVCEDPDRAWAELGRHALYQSQNYARWFAAAGQPVGPVLGTVEELRQRNPGIFLTPGQAIERLKSLLYRARELLPQAELHFYWWSVFPGESVESSTRALELAATNVAPALRES